MAGPGVSFLSHIVPRVHFPHRNVIELIFITIIIYGLGVSVFLFCYFHVLSSIVFREGLYILLIINQGRPSIASVFLYVVQRICITPRHWERIVKEEEEEEDEDKFFSVRLAQW